MSNQRANIERILLSLLILLIPIQLGKHFWPNEALIHGLRIDYLSPTLYVTDCIILILFLLSFFKSHKILSTSIMDFFKRKKGWLLFVLSLCVGIIVSPSPLIGLYGLIKLGEYIFVANRMIKWFSSGKYLIPISSLLIVGIIFESLLALFQIMHQGSLQGVFYWFGERFFSLQTPGVATAAIFGEKVLRPYGTFPHPNVLAGYLLMSMTIVSFSLRQRHVIFFKKTFLSVSLFALLIGTIALFLTLSRVAILLWIGVMGLQAVLLLRAVIRKPLRKKSIIPQAAALTVIASLFVAGVVVLFILLYPLVVSRFFSFRLSDVAIQERLYLVSAAVSFLAEKPLFGVGLNNFLPSLAPLASYDRIFYLIQPVHNIFLLLAAETGFVGLAFISWFAIQKTIGLFRFKNEMQLEKSLLVIFFIIGMFDHYLLTLQQGQLLSVLVLSMILAKERGGGYSKTSR